MPRSARKPPKTTPASRIRRNQLAQSTDQLVQFQANKFISQFGGPRTVERMFGITRDDLVQIGRIALLQAAESYNPNTPNRTPYEKYARERVKGALYDYIRRDGPLIQHSRQVQSQNNAEYVEQLYARLRRKDLSSNQRRMVQEQLDAINHHNAIQNPRSVEQPSPNASKRSSRTENALQIPSRGRRPHHLAQTADLRNAILQMLTGFNVRRQLVFIIRFMSPTREELRERIRQKPSASKQRLNLREFTPFPTSARTGKIIGVSETRVSQIVIPMLREVLQNPQVLRQIGPSNMKPEHLKAAQQKIQQSTPRQLLEMGDALQEIFHTAETERKHKEFK